MLTAETKRKIDNARQVLVGKVPDPKARIEQITNALIYKFMDDMDEQSRQMGGEATFFTGQLAPYAWSKLMDPSIPAQQKMNLYGEALEKFTTSENLPALFRDIFRQAFLPYRDPQTLNLFLKEIDFFDYNHSEELGNAFEYLLSIMGSQGDAGQFRTPRHIIDFVVDIVQPTKDDRILDPACGTAGFLISAYKHILANHDGLDNETGEKTDDETSLTHKQKQTIFNNLVGYDISPDMAKLARVNMYLHDNKKPNIQEYDTLSSDDRWDEMFDVILANPPFMTPKGGIIPHKRFSVKSSKAEVLFVDYIVSHLKSSGKAAIIVPEGIIFDSKAKTIREKLVKEGFLWSVISLPQGAFNPYTDAKTHILFLDQKIGKKADKIYFYKVENDGYDLGLKREPTNKNDLPKLSLNLKKVITSNLHEVKSLESITKEELLLNKNIDLTFGRYTHVEESSGGVKISKVLSRNKTKITLLDNSNYKRVTIKMHGKGIHLRDEVPGSKIGTKNQFIIKSGQLLLSKIDARNGAFGIVPAELDGAIITGNFWTFDISSTININEKYLHFLLYSTQFVDICEKSSAGVTNRRYLKEDIFLSQEIPLPSLEVQKQMVAELDGYQSQIEKKKEEINDLESQITKSVNELWK